MGEATWKILLFGRLRDSFGAPEISLQSDAATARDLRAALAEAHPDLASIVRAPSVRMAVNQRLVADESSEAVAPGDEIALLPPLSGG